jgi:hypothetical protein
MVQVVLYALLFRDSSEYCFEPLYDIFCVAHRVLGFISGEKQSLSQFRRFIFR